MEGSVVVMPETLDDDAALEEVCYALVWNCLSPKLSKR